MFMRRCKAFGSLNFIYGLSREARNGFYLTKHKPAVAFTFIFFYFILCLSLIHKKKGLSYVIECIMFSIESKVAKGINGQKKSIF